MDITFALLARYKSPFVALEEVCEDFFKVSPRKTKLLVASGEFPIPVTRTTSSQKAPYLIKVDDLAKYLDECYASSRDEWERVNRLR
ncbi:pyocin activator PrtN family protein [Endozoicomonas sp.]|uniref:pyocin activator PrtN family protein n=1 Tax=Endozoicomonas sp. TaxID=1892382 RepID=UPI0028857598|nr:pyocin activator PrtN family protein [Endozoicomonas sp.]